MIGTDCIQLPNDHDHEGPLRTTELNIVELDTVKPAHEVTSIKQSPILRGHLSYKPTLSFPKGDLLIQV